MLAALGLGQQELKANLPLVPSSVETQLQRGEGLPIL